MGAAPTAAPGSPNAGQETKEDRTTSGSRGPHRRGWDRAREADIRKAPKLQSSSPLLSVAILAQAMQHAMQRKGGVAVLSPLVCK